MPNYVYVAAQDDNQIAVFTIDGETGRLTRTAEIPMPGGPSLLAIRPNRQCLYVGHRQVPEISSHRIDPATGALRRTGSIAPPDPPGFLATDRRGRHIPSSLVVNQWVGDVASSSPRDFLLLHNLWTPFGRLIRSHITSKISTG